MKKTILLFAALGVALSSGAQKLGTVDSTFGTDGLLEFDQTKNQANELVAGSTPGISGDLYICGYSSTGTSDALVSHVLADGTLDPNFGFNGTVIFDFTLGGREYARSILRKADGKLLVTGYLDGNQSLDVFLAQLNSDGTLDQNFGNAGIVLFSSADDTRAFDVDLRSDGKIVLSGDLNNAGNKDFFIMLLNADGTLVNSFGDQGILKIDFSTYSDSFMALELDKNDGMYIAGRSFDGSKFHASIAKVSALGLFDINFAPSGKLLFQEGTYSTAITNIKLDGDGNLVGVGYVVGGISDDLYIFRILPTGKFDTSFDTDGKRQFGVKIGNSPDERFTALDIQADGKILATATYNDGGVKSSLYIRFRTDGKTDGGFGGPSGYVLIPETTWDAWIGFIHVVSNERALLVGRIYTSEYNTMVSAIHLTEPFATSLQSVDVRSLNVYPNPIQSKFAVDLDWNGGTMELRDMSGKLVAQWSTQANSYTVPTGLNKGVYMLKVNSDSGLFCTKIVIN